MPRGADAQEVGGAGRVHTGARPTSGTEHVEPARGLGFPKAARLLKSRDFRRVLSRGQRLFTRSFILYVHRATGDVSRLGVTVSRKVGPAVVRNRIKRCVREAFRTHPEWFERATDLVVIAKAGRKGAAAARRREYSYRQVVHEIEAALAHRSTRGA